MIIQHWGYRFCGAPYRFAGFCAQTYPALTVAHIYTQYIKFPSEAIWDGCLIGFVITNRALRGPEMAMYIRTLAGWQNVEFRSTSLALNERSRLA